MSAAARLLRRRSSVLLQHRCKIHAVSIPSLVTNIRSHNQLPASVAGSWGFATIARSKPPGGSSSSDSKARKLAAGGAAILVLSAAAWYTNGHGFPQVQRIGLPQVFHGQNQEGKAPVQIDEKSSNRIQSNRMDDGVVKEQVFREITTGQHEKADVEQSVEDPTGDIPSEAVESGDWDLKNSPLPPVDNEPNLTTSEHESEPQQILQEKTLASGETVEKASLPSEEAHQEQIVSSKEAEEHEAEDDQSPLASLTEVIKDKVSAVEEYFLIEANHVDKTKDEVRDNSREEVNVIREKVREANPEMFYSDNDPEDRYNVHHEDEEFKEKPESQEGCLTNAYHFDGLQILKSGSHEDDGAAMVPSKLSTSYLVQRGHEDSVRRYSEKESGGAVPNIVDTSQTFRKDPSEETQVAEEKSNVVGVDVLVGAIHTAEQLQAEVDSRTYQEKLQRMQEVHKHEVKDFQAKILAYAEDTHQLEKELMKEKQEAALALELQEQRAEERLQSELKRKDEETVKVKERLELLGKAETAALITREKAEHLTDIRSLQLQVDALRTAFYTSSEEARISHSVHKLAMGAFALEDAMERGEPVEKEADLLIASTGGPGMDPLVDAVVSSLPSEVLTTGIGTRAQLHHKFSRLKDSLRELALLPSGGGGALAHLVARLTANLKIREQGSDDVGSEGIEVVIGKVERLLAEEKLVEAATVLETGARGTAAESLAVEWARQARNRAIIEQGLQVLRAHVIAVCSGLS